MTRIKGLTRCEHGLHSRKKVGGGVISAVMRVPLTDFGKLKQEPMRCYSKRIVSKQRD
ncbi:hypothetical protein [Paraburkholderia terrae]|uniref:hypothetical protein n=1 Tax=Paraburkholderia terrae TaxID=311230 RepID=UPI001E4617A4|nr:hypothetical protein [Paraburkholderia terrae]